MTNKSYLLLLSFLFLFSSFPLLAFFDSDANDECQVPSAPTLSNVCEQKITLSYEKYHAILHASVNNQNVFFLDRLATYYGVTLDEVVDFAVDNDKKIKNPYKYAAPSISLWNTPYKEGTITEGSIREAASILQARAARLVPWNVSRGQSPYDFQVTKEGDSGELEQVIDIKTPVSKALCSLYMLEGDETKINKKNTPALVKNGDRIIPVTYDNKKQKIIIGHDIDREKARELWSDKYSFDNGNSGCDIEVMLFPPKELKRQVFGVLFDQETGQLSIYPPSKKGKKLTPPPPPLDRKKTDHLFQKLPSFRELLSSSATIHLTVQDCAIIQKDVGTIPIRHIQPKKLRDSDCPKLKSYGINYISKESFDLDNVHKSIVHELHDPNEHQGKLATKIILDMSFLTEEHRIKLRKKLQEKGCPLFIQKGAAESVEDKKLPALIANKDGLFLIVMGDHQERKIQLIKESAITKKLKAQILEREQGTNHYLSEQECSLITIPGVYTPLLDSLYDQVVETCLPQDFLSDMDETTPLASLPIKKYSSTVLFELSDKKKRDLIQYNRQIMDAVRAAIKITVAFQGSI
ncbi:MAG: hypothetical protein HQK52_04655 [Oligoflexia bacterium]|nr:hypothetical protein [Oligoflexia bacterium]